MTCEQIQTHLADVLAGNVPPQQKAEAKAHLATCAQCREEAALVQSAWDKLSLLPNETPTPHLRTRFYDSLAAYQQGSSQTRQSWFAKLWPQRPALQALAALVLLGVTFGSGLYTARVHFDAPQTADLRHQLDQMRTLVTLSLLQQQSASERLRGVNYSVRAEPNSPDVIDALLKAVNEDPDVNVRLAAVDALQKFSKNKAVRQSLLDSLAKQDSPLVQISLVDLLVQLRERQALGIFHQLAADPQVNIAVRDRAQQAIQEFAPRNE